MNASAFFCFLWVDQPRLRYQLRREFRHPLFSQRHNCFVKLRGGSGQPCGIDSLADGRYPPQHPPAAIEKEQGPLQVALFPVVQGDGQLQKPLVKIPQFPLLPHPQLFEGLVAIEPLAPVELPDGKQQLLRRGRFAAGQVSGPARGATREEGPCPCWRSRRWRCGRCRAHPLQLRRSRRGRRRWRRMPGTPPGR